MTDQFLQGRTILVVEDEYLLADELSEALKSAGAVVLGPVPSLEDATALIAAEPAIDAAVLDIRLRDDMVFPVADALHDRGVPFAFATGYDRQVVPERFADAPSVEKPFHASRIAAVLEPLLARAA